jgi:FG-GAP repeat
MEKWIMRARTIFVFASRRVVVAAMLMVLGAVATTSCDTASLPEFVRGQEVIGNSVPTLSILRPDADTSISQGQGLVIEWIDADRDDDATISFSLVAENDPSVVIPLVDGIRENDDVNPDRFTASTLLVPLGTYRLRGTIDDGRNRPVTAVALSRAAGLGEVLVSIVEEGTTVTVDRPPQVFVSQPAINLSVSQDDTLVITVQPLRESNVDPGLGLVVDDPFDVDSSTTLYIVLDLDDDPRNDNVIAPDPTKIIPIADPLNITIGDFETKVFPIVIDLETIPLRRDGSPYYIRATIMDGLNTPVHSYAAGTINVVRSASGLVDLGEVGRTLAGARMVGFNPGSRLGTTMVSLRDFDMDGVDDFAMLAQFGNPRNLGNIGEGYVIYGQAGIRFGGTINVNSTSRSLPGFILEGPPMRGPQLGISNPRTEGITDIGIVPDLNGDGRPELLVGMPHAEGQFQARDDDPDDNPPEGDETLRVEIVLRQGPDGKEVSISNEDEPVQSYFGVEDTVISSAEPDRNFRAADLEWVNRGPADIMYSLVKFKGVLLEFPAGDTPDRIADITGSLAFQVLNTGGQATIHELFTDFDASTVTFNNFLNGAAPVAGEDYEEEELANINANGLDGVQVQINDLLQRLLINDLPNSEIRLIIIPGEDGAEDADDNVRLASSEFADTRQRPQLTITYNREVIGGPFGCYPDLFANNFSDEGDEDAGRNERKFEASGFVTVIHSTNRDNAGIINPDRLADTIVSLELVGQRPIISLPQGIIQRAEGDEPARIEGCRFQAGFYDFQDHLQAEQPPLNGMFGRRVSFIEDLDLDQTPEIIISAPTNEMDHAEILQNFGATSTHFNSRNYTGSIVFFPGTDYDADFWRDKPGNTGTSVIPGPTDEAEASPCEGPGTCDPTRPVPRCGLRGPAQAFQIFAEDPTDYLGGARSAGDFNRDSVPDLLCGAKFNDLREDLPDTGAVYIVYMRSPTGDFDLSTAEESTTRPPMLRIRGETPGDQIGWAQEPVRDVNGDGVDDVMIASPFTDFILARPECDVTAAEVGIDRNLFNGCSGLEVFKGDSCKAFDFNNDRTIDADDRAVFDCLEVGGGSDCCPVDNGFIGIIFGGVNRQGDRTISQLGTSELPGVVFYGTSPGDLAGYAISTAGDFDKDGFGDILIAAPGETRLDSDGNTRLGVSYLVFGGPHLENQATPIELSEIGDRIPGIVFMTPFVDSGPDEAPTDNVGHLGDINDDGFSDIAIGVTRADLLDDTFPQGEGGPNDTGRRPDQGDAYIIYGNNIGR